MAAESSPEHPRRFQPMTVALAVAGVLAGATALLPETVRPWNVAAVGAVALFAAARLGFVSALVVTALAITVKDVGVYLNYGWPPEPLSWLAFVGYVAIGSAFLRHTESPTRIGFGVIGASLVFFLVSNFGSWVVKTLPYENSLAGLLECYRAALPFYRGTLVGDLLGAGVLFGLHAALSRAYFPAERVMLVEEGPHAH